MSSSLSAAEVDDLLGLLWPVAAAGDGSSTDDDSQRWYRQGFEFQTLAGFPLGLVQGHGGPCGVLAAVQAEMLRIFLFQRHRNTVSSADVDLQQLMQRERLAEDESRRLQLLAEALASLLTQCVGDDGAVRVVVQDTKEGGSLTYRESLVNVHTERTDSPPPDLVGLLLHEMPTFCSPHGVINFTFSVLRTKGVAAVREEMDDPTNALTGAFGHCTQELLNLLLTGKAVSNVFDGSVPMGDTGLFLHGVPERARIGYLTQLEALRYCQVGSYYKSPQFPVWVLGSSSHFSVGFALDPRVCEESASVQLFQRVQRVFKSFDPQETGFMQMASLAESLLQLGVAPEVLSNEYEMARLLARLEISSGAGIVLWDEYWKVISVLLHTGDFEMALSGKYDANTLQRSDSDLARELQAQFDAEERGGSAGTIQISTAPTPVLPAKPDPLASFDWFYYNGLGHNDTSAGRQRPLLTKCRVTLKKSAEFIGKSVPIENVGASGGHGSPPLEEILKTKWPSARIDWLGSQTPSID
ncbi:putative ubiquitin carboxyl-terminal hydrolase MINDY-4 [Phytophthora citrophthora]|uniref:Ubiquitin carboxyl-terminal hydrolase MINDY-4 n=1 Tax=Phytophthora citrophthora TaxID=4793 RepID=A0AAD9G5T8_9STRA|nr:putative ubiquitin carboxyl-terminal hydrolase MINDY-4 [Phytophthora citrophthora]